MTVTKQRTQHKTKSLDSLNYDIKQRRKEKGMSQTEIAKFCDVSIIAYQRWENGTTKKVRTTHFNKLKEVLGDE